MYYIYAYLDPRKKGKFNYNNLSFEYEPFYIGKGKGKRCYKGIKRPGKNFKGSKIKKLKSLGLMPIIIKIYENLTEQEAFELEIKTISNIGRFKYDEGPLTNISESGDGITIKISESTRKKISKAHKGKKISKEHKKAISETLKGRIPWNKGKTMSIITRKKMSKSHTGKKQGEMRSNIYLVTNPYGISTKIKGLKHFCNIHNLSVSQMRRVSNGILETYNGWNVIKLTDKYKR